MTCLVNLVMFSLGRLRASAWDGAENAVVTSHGKYLKHNDKENRKTGRR